MDNTLSDLMKPKNDCPYVSDTDLLRLRNDEMYTKIHVLHLNVRSYHKHFDKLTLMLDDLLELNVVPDIVMLCETFLNSQSAQLVAVPGYQTYFRNRDNRLGGGVLILVKKSILVLEILDTPFNDVVETLFLKIKLENKIYCVGELYRIPNTNLEVFVHNCKSVLEKTNTFANVIIGADHNLDLIKASNHKATANFMESFVLKGLIPSINKPTRITH